MMQELKPYIELWKAARMTQSAQTVYAH